MAVAGDQLIVREGIGPFQPSAAEAPGGFLFGIEEEKALLKGPVHRRVIEGHAGVGFPLQRLVAHISGVPADRREHAAVALRLPAGEFHDGRLPQRLFQGLAAQIPDNGLEFVTEQLRDHLWEAQKGAAVKEGRRCGDTVLLQLREELHPHFAAHGLTVDQRDGRDGPLLQIAEDFLRFCAAGIKGLFASRVLPAIIHGQDAEFPFQLLYDVRHGVGVAEGAGQHDNDGRVFRSVRMNLHVSFHLRKRAFVGGSSVRQNRVQIHARSAERGKLAMMWERCVFQL